MSYDNDADGPQTDWMSIYCVSTKRKVAKREVVPGWTLQWGDDQVMRIELRDDRYQVASSAFE